MACLLSAAMMPVGISVGKAAIDVVVWRRCGTCPAAAMAYVFPVAHPVSIAAYSARTFHLGCGEWPLLLRPAARSRSTSAGSTASANFSRSLAISGVVTKPKSTELQ